MQTTAPNQTHLKIISSILQLETFTVAELCLHSGLQPAQVYRELAELQGEKVLRSESNRTEGVTLPRHRPTKIYELSSDPPVRERLEKDLGAFLPESADPNSNRHLKRANQELGELHVELLGASIRPLDDIELHLWESRYQKRFNDVQRELRRASWESEVDFSEGDHSNHPIVKAKQAYESLHSNFVDQIGTERARRNRKATRLTWIDIVSPALASVLPFARVPALVASRGTFEYDVDLSDVSNRLVEEVRKRVEYSHVASGTEIEDIGPYLNSLQLDLREVRSTQELLAALAKNWISYGNRIDEAWLCARALAEESNDYRLVFNEANLAQLAQHSETAFESWIKYLSMRTQRSGPAEQSLVARIDGERWSLDAYQEAVRIITKECEASVSAFSEIPFERDGEYDIESKLYNPLFDESGRESALISIAEPLAQDARLHVLTTEATRPALVGLPSVTKAGLYYRRIADREAWKLAVDGPGDERIVMVDFFRNATADIRSRAGDVLRTNLFAELVG